jgi:hypothetical protein
MSSALTAAKPKTSSLKTALLNAAVVLVATLFSLAGIEICLRVWGPEVVALGDIYVFYRYDPVLGWDNLPNARGYLTRAEYSIEVSNNSLGMRDVEIGAKRPGEYRVAFLGDSFTWGVGVSYGERFTEVAGKLDPRNPHAQLRRLGLFPGAVSVPARPRVPTQAGLHGAGVLPRQ